MAVLLLAYALATRADEGVVLSLKDGTEVAFTFATKPRLAMGEELTISSTDGTKVVYAYADVKDIRFGELITTGIDSVLGKVETPEVTFRISGGQLQVIGLPIGESVSVYDLDGRRVAMQKQNADGTHLFVPCLARGVLVVRTSTGLAYRVLIP